MKLRTIRTALLWVGPALISCDSPTGQGDGTPPVVEEAAAYTWVSGSAIKEFVGTTTTSFKLLFTSRKDALIRVVDFAEPLVYDSVSGDSVQYSFTLKKPRQYENYMIDSPLLNANGKLVAYWLHAGDSAYVACVQGVAPEAEAVIVAEKGAHPHWHIDPHTEQAFLIYSDMPSTRSGGLDEGAGGSTFKQLINYQNGQAIFAPVSLVNMPLNGGLSSDGRYLCTANDDAAFYDVRSDRLLPINASGSSRVRTSDPSICPDPAHPDWMLFLPFDGEQNVSYGSLPSPGGIARHQYLFIVDKDNVVQWYMERPAGYEGWQDPEWTNKSDFIVSLARISGTAADGAHDLFLIDRAGNRTLLLSTGEAKLDETATPFFWIGG